MSKKILPQKRNGRLIPVMDTNPKDFPHEKWKDIPNLDYYQVSNYGRIRSLDRYIQESTGKECFKKGQIIKLNIRVGKHASQIDCFIGGKKSRRHFSISRLVYKLFVSDFDYEERSSVVAKKDNDPLNCYYRNLKLISVSQNITNGYAAGKRVLPQAAPVHQYNATGKYMETFSSKEAAARKMEVSVSAIRTAAELHRRCRGFYWRHGEIEKKIDLAAYDENRKQRIGHIKQPVLKIASTGKIMQSFESIIAAVKATKGHRNEIDIACRNPNKKYKGFFWRYGKRGNPVQQYDAEGLFIKSHTSPYSAAQSVGASPISIRDAARLKERRLHGFYWRYGEPQARIKVTPPVKRRSPKCKYVQQLTQGGVLVSNYPSIKAASDAMGVSTTQIRNVCRKNIVWRGFQWEFA